MGACEARAPPRGKPRTPDVHMSPLTEICRRSGVKHAAPLISRVFITHAYIGCHSNVERQDENLCRVGCGDSETKVLTVAGTPSRRSYVLLNRPFWDRCTFLAICFALHEGSTYVHPCKDKRKAVFLTRKHAHSCQTNSKRSKRVCLRRLNPLTGTRRH